MMTNDNPERESNILKWMHVVFALVCIVMLCRIVYIQCCFRNSDPYLKYFRAANWKQRIYP